MANLAFGVFSYSGGSGGKSGNGTGGRGCSFDPDTPVLMDGGKTTPISKIKPGDKVEAADPTTGKHEGPRPVTATWINNDTDLLDVIIQGVDGHLATLHTTANHPFWDDTTRTWTPAGELRPGDTLKTVLDQDAIVFALQRIPSPARDMYNLTIQDLHTYYVLAGTTAILVHNDGSYFPAPARLPGFPNAQKVKPMSPRTGGGGLRARWQDGKNILEWDYQHGTVEMYNKRGQHLGEFDANSGAPTKPPAPGRTCNT